MGGSKWIVSFKAVRENYSSIFDPASFTYDKIGKLYETKCNYNELDENSFGFSSWTYEGASIYAKDCEIKNYKIIKIGVPLSTICMLTNGSLRSPKLIIL